MIDILHSEIGKKLKVLFNGKTYKTIKTDGDELPGDKRVELNIFEQYIPPKNYNSEAEEFPYLFIRTLDGTTPTGQDDEKPDIKVVIQIGIYDDNEDYQGSKDVLNIINKITTEFAQNHQLGAFEITRPMTWAVNQDDFFPLFVGAITTFWSYTKTQLQSNEHI